MLPTMLDLLLRSTLVLLFVELVTRWPRGQSAARRHKLRVAGFVLLLFWPVFRVLLPEVGIPLIPDLGNRASVTVQQSFRAASENRSLSSLAPGCIVWATGASLALLLLAADHLRVWRFKRNGVSMPDAATLPVMADAARQCHLRRIPRILLFAAPVMPQITGAWNETVLLPREWQTWTGQRQRAVLLHEFAHVQRRDTLCNLLVNVVTALWWFQPLCWVARRRVRAESEQACDAAVVACGIAPSAYAAELLSMAQAFRSLPRATIAATPMAEAGSLEFRLRSVLASPLSHLPERSLGGAIALLTVWAATCSAITIASNGHLISEGGVSMRRTVFATTFTGLLTSAGLSAAAIGGLILDPNGTAVTNARASLYNPDTKAHQEALSENGGKFEFDHLQAGQYILRVDKPGFAPIMRAFNVGENSNVERGFTLRSEPSGTGVPAAENNPTPTNTQMETKAIRVGGKVAQSNLTSKVQPLYPPAAKAAGVQGTVMLEAVISDDGVPQDIRVVSSPDEDLSQSALEAVRQWRYRPTLLNGNPVTIITDIVVNYTLAP